MVFWFAAFVAAISAPAAAQGFFETLFGGFGVQKPAPQAAPPRGVPPATTYQWRGPSGFSTYDSRGVSRAPVDRNRSTGQYRTVCVRLCDGYYFPISHGVSRSRFFDDANRCSDQCSGEARLFFMPAASARIEDAVDQSGLGYEGLANAFVYRKKRIASCECRPKPWSYPERARHDAYAVEDARAQTQRTLSEEQAEADKTGVTTAVVRHLFDSATAEALPPAPADDWVVPEKGELRLVIARPDPLPRPGGQADDGRRHRAAYRGDDRRVRKPRGHKKKPAGNGGWLSGLGGPARYRWPGDAR